MIRTEYSWMTTDELLQHAEFRVDGTRLEKELALRLEAALVALAEGGVASDVHYITELPHGKHS